MFPVIISLITFNSTCHSAVPGSDSRPRLLKTSNSTSICGNHVVGGKLLAPLLRFLVGHMPCVAFHLGHCVRVFYNHVVIHSLLSIFHRFCSLNIHFCFCNQSNIRLFGTLECWPKKSYIYNIFDFILHDILYICTEMPTNFVIRSC
jgi:hypothetical protein